MNNSVCKFSTLGQRVDFILKYFSKINDSFTSNPEKSDCVLEKYLDKVIDDIFAFESLSKVFPHE